VGFVWVYLAHSQVNLHCLQHNLQTINTQYNLHKRNASTLAYFFALDFFAMRVAFFFATALAHFFCNQCCIFFAISVAIFLVPMFFDADIFCNPSCEGSRQLALGCAG